MKNIYLLIVFFFVSIYLCHAQYAIGNDGPTAKWIKLGSIALSQGGNDCFIRVVGGSGYNASINQQGNIEIHIRTSNWSSVDGNGYAFAATAVSYGRAQFISQIKILPDNAGTSATAYNIYVYCGPWLGTSYFTVESLTGTWTSSLTSSSSDPGGYDVPFELSVNIDSFFAGKVGIGTTTTSSLLTINTSLEPNASPSLLLNNTNTGYGNSITFATAGTVKGREQCRISFCNS